MYPPVNHPNDLQLLWKKISLQLKPLLVRFTPKELDDLLLSFVVLSMTFAFAGLHVPPIGILLGTVVGVGAGFLLHELGHKFAAQHYGLKAEFRMTPKLLAAGALIGVVTGIILAAPGAVLIYRYAANKAQDLWISLAGPCVNIVIATASLALLACVILPGFFVHDPSVMGVLDQAGACLQRVALINAWLSIFNLIPLGPLDGKKVMDGNKQYWAYAMAASVALFLVGVFA